MFSQIQKMTPPSFLTIEIRYLALFFCVSSVCSPCSTISQFTALGSIAAQRLIKKRESPIDLSLRSFIAGALSPTSPLAQVTKSFSVLSPMTWR